MSIIMQLRPRDTGGDGSVSVFSGPTDTDAGMEIESFVVMCEARKLDPADEILKVIQHAHDAMLAE